MGSKAIYLDENSEKALEKIKKENPEFVFSEFIQSCILKFNKTSGDEFEDLNWEYDKKKIQFDALGDELRLISEKRAYLQSKKDQELLDKTSKEEREKIKKAERIDAFADNFLFFFNLTPEKARVFAEDYENIPRESRQTIFDYGKSIGLIEKEGWNDK